MSIRSMTGFARVRDTIDDVDVVISVKTVNHRGLDVHFYAGSELDPFEPALRGVVKRTLGRGHIDVRVQVSRASAAGPISIDMPRLEAYVAAWRGAAERLGIAGAPDLDAALRVPGILSDAGVTDLGEEFEAPLTRLLEQALETLNAFREREGAEIAVILLDRACATARAADDIESLRTNAQPAFQGRLKDRLADLLGGTAIDPQRLVQEAALLADRSDIGEEIERLRIHARQVEDLLRKGGEVGKKLDFLLQEMNRETNTILSKTSGLGEAGLRITELAISAKSHIEKMREQSLNLE